MLVHYPNYRGLRSAITGRKVPVLQTVICTVFISGTLSLLQFVAGEAKLNHIPDNDRHYRQCVLVQSYMISDKAALQRDLQNSRYAQRVIPYSESFEILHNDLNDPMGRLFNDMRMQSLRNYHMSDGDLTAQDISPWLSVAGGVIFMLTVILVTVWGNIKGIMRLNPVEYMEKE